MSLHPSTTSKRRPHEPVVGHHYGERADLSLAQSANVEQSPRCHRLLLDYQSPRHNRGRDRRRLPERTTEFWFDEDHRCHERALTGGAVLPIPREEICPGDLLAGGCPDQYRRDIDYR